ncbi:MAG: 1-deoxy-D-xylulose-5-phosphate synthase [Planctomycetaceae bacterium]|nr:1-deoxy-D-xylulose-5-phosphate synthase [Planctomycetaceae bacterium]
MELELLPRLESPTQLGEFSDDQLLTLADEIREVLCSVVSDRTAHFASNLGVVELAIALHLVYDFRRDRLIWDTGHQIYPHKLLTGRFAEFQTMRQRGGLMGYPNPEESDYDLFMTGHAGASLSTVLGLKIGDDHQGEQDRRAVAVIGDGALPSGIVFEAMNNAAGLKKDVLLILNDNKMGICPRVGGLAATLDKARTAPFYDGLKRDIQSFLNKVPLVGQPVESILSGFKDAVKGFLHGGMFFEELGFRYIGPVDGHDLFALRRYLEMVKNVRGPVLLHVFTEKGHGFKPASEDPVRFHTPAPFQRNEDNQVVSVNSGSSPTYTNVVSETIHAAMAADPKVVVLTAAMCAGNKLDRIRDDFPDRFFDTGICESHAVAFAAGMAKAGLKPVTAIYSTFLQRSFDQIFQEVALQGLPVTFCLDRSGLCGPDGPTHHGVFDHSYLRPFPGLTVMAPGDAGDAKAMLAFALDHDGPVALRYPKATAENIPRDAKAIELGRSEVFRWGRDGMFLVCGTLLGNCVAASDRLRDEFGLDVGVINARFVKPFDIDRLAQALDETGFVITVEENILIGGFGSAAIESAVDAGLDTRSLHRCGLPDDFIEHGDRDELLALHRLDVDGLVQTARQCSRSEQETSLVKD